MANQSKLFIAALAAVVFSSSQALAWADLGHSIVGGIAEENIKPETRDFVRGVLGVEPLGTAAVWPDHVKDDDRFAHRDDATNAGENNTHGFSDYHFCEIPVGFDYGSRPKKYLKDCHGVILGAIELLKDVKGQHTRSEKMIALRYLAHVMGDITQPLHVGNGHDQGGNVCQVKWQSSAASTPVQINLHAFWDDTMVNYLGTTYADSATGKKAALYYSQFLEVMKVRRAEMFGEAAKKQYGTGTLEGWLLEAANLRESGVYPDDPTAMASVPKGEEYKNRPYCQWFDADGKLGSGKIDPAKIPTLGVEYGDRFAKTVESQLLIGGLRLAKTLDDIAESVARTKHSVNTITTAQQEAILAKVQKSFFNPPADRPTPASAR